MRKTLYRAKPYFGDNKWIYGGIMVREVVQQYGKFKCAFHPTYIISRDDDYLWCPVDPETVGQFIGTDKNDVMMFEGDCFTTHCAGLPVYRHIVRYYPEHYAFMARCIETNAVHYLSDYRPSAIEVIGNIYDNPELKEKCE